MTGVHHVAPARSSTGEADWQPLASTIRRGAMTEPQAADLQPPPPSWMAGEVTAAFTEDGTRTGAKSAGKLPLSEGEPALAHLVCAVMAGGTGTRFWPLSRHATPKQLLTFFGERTLLEATFDRVAPLCPPDRRLVVTAAHLVAPVQKLLPELRASAVLGEPMQRNTAPCMAVAALSALHLDPDAILVLLPADHWIADPTAFRSALKLAAERAHGGAIVTLGVAPSHPETGYGYIQLGGEVAPGVRQVQRFVEKPSVDVALQYLAGGQHLWNAGVFVLRADRAWRALQQHVPGITEALQPLWSQDPGGEVWRDRFADCFGACPSISIDYGVMEKESAIEVVRLDAGWSDVGTWLSLAGMRAENQENFIRGDVVAIDCQDCVLISEGPLVAAVGLKGFAVIATPDATLVLPTERSQDVREVVAELQQRGLKGLL